MEGGIGEDLGCFTEVAATASKKHKGDGKRCFFHKECARLAVLIMVTIPPLNEGYPRTVPFPPGTLVGQKKEHLNKNHHSIYATTR